MKYQVKIRKVFNTDKPVKALASVTIDNKIAIHGVRVIRLSPQFVPQRLQL